MNFKIFKNKKLNTEGDKINLAQPTMLFRSLDPSEYVMVAKHTVSDDDVVRPDLIAVKHYNSTSGLDIILKFNGISDPFSIMPGETLWIPIDSIPYYKLETPAMYEDNPIKNQFIQSKRLSTTDKRRLEALKIKYNKENLLPPNVIPVGRKNYEFDGTNVRLGMGPQTDDVVASIMKDINSDIMAMSMDTSSSLVIDIDDNDQVDNIPKGGSIDYEKELEKNSGKTGTGTGTGGTGTGTGGTGTGGTGTGTGKTGTGSGVDGSKTDVADEVGGNIPDGTSPANSNNQNPENPDSPCAK